MRPVTYVPYFIHLAQDRRLTCKKVRTGVCVQWPKLKIGSNMIVPTVEDCRKLCQSNDKCMDFYYHSENGNCGLFRNGCTKEENLKKDWYECMING